MIRRWLFYLVLLSAALAFHIYYYGWLSWYLLALTLALPPLSLLLSLPAMLGQHVRWNWQTDARVHRGNSAILRLSGQSARLPARCQLRLQITHLNSGRREECALRLAEGVPLELDTSHCGVLRCEMTSGWVYDYLGLFRLPRKLPAARELTVLPIPAPPDPVPKMDGLEYKRWKPKPGGGFAELHELRGYRPGDPLNSVHWKLSAKTDNLIVREAMEPIRRLVLVSFDLTQTRLDETLDQLCWLCERLLQQDVVHELRWLEPASGELHSVTIECREDFDAVLEQLLRTKLQRNSPSLRDRVFPEADWRYHIK